ncbi:hypothetical protein [Rhodoferax sp. GW822-FHT02A01]|uniref:hypothetical protein n=1 Tax=Rhodoferax sp. GW822-FHT02A01 TaxID=3141537 RepID=UPI00315C6484
MSWLSPLLSTSTPSLPVAWAMHAGLALGWALVLAALGVGLTCRLSLRTRRVVAAVLVAWTLLPGPLTPDYWLGLAFHAPSLSAMLLCGWWLWRSLFPPSHQSSTPAAGPGLLLLVPLALGYVLLLDTFAVLPWQVYAWGFSPLLLLVLLLMALLPWVFSGASRAQAGLTRWLTPAALLLYAATRLPTGNLWDALLDPLLWLFLHGLLVRALYRRYKGLKRPTSPAATRD